MTKQIKTKIGLSILALFVTLWSYPPAVFGQREASNGFVNAENSMRVLNRRGPFRIDSHSSAQAITAPFSAFSTSTPDENGSIYHVVSSGESLWSIAISYGVTINEICNLNQFIDDSLVIKPGQKLLIIPIYSSPTVESTDTTFETIQLLGGTATPFEGIQPAVVNPSPAVTDAPENIPSSVPLERSPGVLVTLVVIFVALTIVFVYGFRR